MISLDELDKMSIDEAQRLPFAARDALLDPVLAEGRGQLERPQIPRQAGLFCDYFAEDVTRMLKLRAVRLTYSGFIPVNERGEVPTLDPRGQFTLCFDNIKRALDQMGTRLDRVTGMLIFLKNMDYWAEMNAVYRDYFQCRPTRACLGIADLNLNYQIEVAGVTAYRVAR